MSLNSDDFVRGGKESNVRECGKHRTGVRKILAEH